MLTQLLNIDKLYTDRGSKQKTARGVNKTVCSLQSMNVDKDEPSTTSFSSSKDFCSRHAEEAVHSKFKIL